MLTNNHKSYGKIWLELRRFKFGMKKMYKFATFGVLAAVLFIVPSAMAQDTTTTEVVSEQTESQETVTAPVQKQTALENAEKRKQAVKETLTAAKEKRLQERCSNAQGRVMSVSGQVNGLRTSRTEVHQNILNRLTDVQTRLQTQGVDTVALDEQLTEFRSKTEAFTALMDEYAVLLTDITADSCADDVAAFQASLSAAREALAEIRAESAAIRVYLAETIKPTLQQLREQIIAPLSEEQTEGAE